MDIPFSIVRLNNMFLTDAQVERTEFMELHTKVFAKLGLGTDYGSEIFDILVDENNLRIGVAKYTSYPPV
ncbi:MAG: hypothetical protein EOM50_24005 [Erysipelotrichia bacterium]|nr:hypothetical protein [Erysipelotrichia bacterium]